MRSSELEESWRDKFSLMFFRLQWTIHCFFCKLFYISNCEECEYKKTAETCPFCQTVMVKLENGRFTCPNEACPLTELWHKPHEDVFVMVEAEEFDGRKLGEEFFSRVKNEREQLKKVLLS